MLRLKYQNTRTACHHLATTHAAPSLVRAVTNIKVQPLYTNLSSSFLCCVLKQPAFHRLKFFVFQRLTLPERRASESCLRTFRAIELPVLRYVCSLVAFCLHPCSLRLSPVEQLHSILAEPHAVRLKIMKLRGNTNKLCLVLSGIRC
jgi:hypothetical protein